MQPTNLENQINPNKTKTVRELGKVDISAIRAEIIAKISLRALFFFSLLDWEKGVGGVGWAREHVNFAIFDRQLIF